MRTLAAPTNHEASRSAVALPLVRRTHRRTMLTQTFDLDPGRAVSAACTDKTPAAAEELLRMPRARMPCSALLQRQSYAPKPVHCDAQQAMRMGLAAQAARTHTRQKRATGGYL